MAWAKRGNETLVLAEDFQFLGVENGFSGSRQRPAFGRLSELKPPPPAISPAQAATAAGMAAPPKLPAFKRPPPAPTSTGSEATSPTSTGSEEASSRPSFSKTAPPKAHPAFRAAPPPLAKEDEEKNSSAAAQEISKPPQKPAPPPISVFRNSVQLSMSSGFMFDMFANQTEEVDEADYPFKEPDSESNLVFTPESINLPCPVIKGGTLEKLVERLTYDKHPDTNYVNAFLLTYRSFTTPTELLSLLITRFNVPIPRDLDESGREAFIKNHQNPIQLRVYNVLKTWIGTHFYDFSSDAALVNTLLRFATTDMKNTGNPAMEKAAEQIQKMVTRKTQKTESEAGANIQFSTPPPKPILPPNLNSFTLLDLDPTEVARQLTLIEHALYKSIKPQECLGQAWTKKATRDEKAPNIMAMIQRFNTVSRWVTSEILRMENIKKRAEVLTKFIQIAEGCEKLNNYNGMMEIISGLQSSAIFRLKHTWALCTKHLKKYEQIHALMARDKNFGKFRDHLHSVDPPCIPYVGVYLTDLTFIEDGNKDYLDNGLINFDKRRKISQVIREIQQYQQTPYCLEAVPAIQKYLTSVTYLEENETYTLSLQIEPKDMDPSKDKTTLKKSLFKKKPDKKNASAASSAQPAQSQQAPAEGPHPEAEEEEDWGELEVIEGYRFYAPDSKDNLIFDIDVSSMVEGAHPTIRAATIEKLIERLTHEAWPDPSLLNTFLLTYRTFTTHHEVIDLLTMRLSVPMPKDATQELRERYTSQKCIPIRLRVFNVAKNWVERYFHPELADEQFIAKFNNLAEKMQQCGMDKASATLKRAIQRQQEGISDNIERRQMGKPPAPILPKNLTTAAPSFLDFNCEEIARQFALIEQRMFLQLKPWELLNQAWLSPDSLVLSPNVIAITTRAARVRDWVATEIVKQTTIEQAAECVTQWIKIAEKCLALNNFNAMMEILSGLQMPDIQKLKPVWSMASSKNVFQKLSTLLDGNFTKLQEKLHNVPPPCVPYLGAYLHNLSEVETKYPNELQGLINFEKRTLIAAALTEVQQYQQTLYCLEPVALIQDWMESALAEIFSAEQIAEHSAPLLVRPTKSKKKGGTLSAEEVQSASSSPTPSLGSSASSPAVGGGGGTPGPALAAARSSAGTINRTTSIKLAKILGREVEEVISPGDGGSGGSGGGAGSSPTMVRAGLKLPETKKRSWGSGSSSGARASVGESNGSSPTHGSREGSRESSELGLDKQASLKFQLLSIFLDDAEFRQSVQDLFIPDWRKEFEEYKAATNAQIQALKAEIETLRTQSH